MKVQVVLKIASKAEATSSTFELTVSPSDTVVAVKERVSMAQMIAFPEQDLLLDGEVLPDAQQLCNCGVKENSSLDFVVKASEDSLAKQLADLLQARDLSCDELGLLYCYKHGVSVGQALKTVGFDGKLADFLRVKKGFRVESGRATLVREDTALKPFSVSGEVVKILEASPSKSMDITALCAKFVQKFNVSIASVSDMKPAAFLASEKALFVVTGRNTVCLKSAQAHSPQAAEPVEKTPEPMLAPSAAVTAVLDSTTDNQQYLDLHNRISGRSFNSKVAQILNDIVDVVSDAMFLNVDYVVKGGSVGKGTSIVGVADAEVVFFLKGMPAAAQDRALPPLLKSVSGVLKDRFGGQEGVEGIRVADNGVQMRVKGLLDVRLRFSPVFDAFGDAIEMLAAQTPEARRGRDAALAKESVQFIAKQPGQVKVTIRLLKWWREQQEWSGAMSRPSDELLELVAVYSAVQGKPADQSAAVANAMSLLARFDELRIVWSNFYSKEDVWAPLLRQTPLLMDPVNPFVNVADPQTFDPRELMALAKSTHFFW